ncbi:protein-export membrane protein SecD [Gammaproteobacteria bacterium 45_16_T64]|mgnify:CR=1 FL=1|nr:protein-export membrane protein SecD [Gammaproteobacteria bacterium 45_16_T64]
MLNKYPLWKYLLLVVVITIGTIYSLPNLYPDDPAVQISGASAAIKVDLLAVDRAKEALNKAGIAYKSADLLTQLPKSGLFRFNDTDAQLKAKKVISETLGEKNFVVALNLAPTTPDWLASLGASPMKLGLDLRGGVHFLMEVNMETALDKRMEDTVAQIRDKLREDKIYYKQVVQQAQGAVVSFKAVELQEQASDVLSKEFREYLVEESTKGDELLVTLTLTAQARKDIEDYAISQNLTSIRNRVNLLGVAEPIVQRQGANRIVIQIPGIQDAAAAKRVIGKAASLEFRLVDWENPNFTGSRAPAGSELLPFNEGGDVLLKKKVIVNGDRVIGARSNYDENGRPQVNINLDSRGGKMMNTVTRKHVKDRMAVVFIELKPEKKVVVENGVETTKVVIKKIREVINIATIQSALGNDFRITGLDSPEEASELALLLRAGALAAPMYFVEERTVGPSLGAENIASGLMSLQIGFGVVMIFMIAYYRVFGLFANIALTVNLLLLVAVMSLIPGATLSLPGMAGIVLTVGMAVDANVLIFSRIKEELAAGARTQEAIHSGFDRAFVTILDANITTLLVALILFIFGSGPVKGFSVTLSIGIITSMFTAIVGTRALVNLVYGGSSQKKLSL